jgi:hypothetical protein
MDSHYVALMLAYASIAGMWFLIFRIIEKPWDEECHFSFQKPWLEFIYAILAVIAILGIGQLYVRGMLIPNNGNNCIDALNQILIFSPTVLLVAIRKQSIETIWLPKSKIPIRIIWGLVMALISLIIYSLIRKDAANLVHIISNTYHPKNISHFVQVFMEDITIALVFVRLAEWIGRKWSIGIVAFLFAAGHIPSLLASGVTTNELSSLFIDAAIGIIVLSAVSKSKDIWWFFIVHFALDMTQFYGGIN